MSLRVMTSAPPDKIPATPMVDSAAFRNGATNPRLPLPLPFTYLKRKRTL